MFSKKALITVYHWTTQKVDNLLLIVTRLCGDLTVKWTLKLSIVQVLELFTNESCYLPVVWTVV